MNVKVSSQWISGFQVVADFLSILSAYLLSYWIYTGLFQAWSPQTFNEFFALSCVLGLIYLFFIEREDLYRREISLMNVKEFRGICHVALYAAVCILSLTFYVRSLNLSRFMLTSALILSPIFLYVQRSIFYQFHLYFHRKGYSQRKVLIYGAGQIGLHLAKRLLESPSLGLLPIGFLDDDKKKWGQSIRWLGASCPKKGLPILGGEELLETLVERGVEQVLIALPAATYERNQKLVELCLEKKIHYAIVPNTHGKFIQNIEIFEIGGIPLFRTKQHRISTVYLMIKRLLDFIFGGIALIVFSPLALFISVWIKLDSPGPVLFKHKRVGLKGREFSLYKFRSMYIHTPSYAQTPLNGEDPRITRVGRFLRRTSLDELPQLLNVFRGDMSLVGPRPEMPFIVAEYSPLHRLRLEVKPGITGVWQISAARGEPIHANIEYDLFYLENCSLLLDFAILLKTVFSVARGIGAN